MNIPHPPEFFNHYRTLDEVKAAVNDARDKDREEAARIAGFYAFHRTLVTGGFERFSYSSGDFNANGFQPGWGGMVYLALTHIELTQGSFWPLDVAGSMEAVIAFARAHYALSLLSTRGLKDSIRDSARARLVDAGLLADMNSPIIPEFIDDDLHRNIILDIGFSTARMLPSHLDLRYSEDWGEVKIGAREQLALFYGQFFKERYDEERSFDDMEEFVYDLFRDETDPLNPMCEDDLFIIGKTAILEPKAFCRLKLPRAGRL